MRVHPHTTEAHGCCNNHFTGNKEEGQLIHQPVNSVSGPLPGRAGSTDPRVTLGCEARRSVPAASPCRASRRPRQPRLQLHRLDSKLRAVWI